MQDDEYVQLPGTKFWVRDVSATFGPVMAELLERDRQVKDLTFPRLQFPALTCIGYSSSHYEEVAHKIREGKIDVYETREDHHFNASYRSYGSLNFFVITPKVSSSPALSMCTIVHEVTHAIQDWKQWRTSGLDRELDAHFAEALYLFRSGKESEAASDLRMTRFMIAAREYNGNPRYFLSIGFRRLREKLRNDIYEHYRFMHATFDDNFDPEEFDRSFRRRKRLDGIPA
jgi:hypothetical protein